MSNDTQPNRPVASHRDGAIEVAVWKQDNGERGASYNTERTRSFKDKDGNWQKTHVIPERDLLKAARLDEKAYESIQQIRQNEREKYIQQQKQAAQHIPTQEQSRER